MPAIRSFSEKFFPPFFFAWHDRGWAADHEKPLFSLSRYFLPAKTYEILERRRFSRKAHIFRNMQNVLSRSFFQFLETFPPDSASKTEQNHIVKLIQDSKLYFRWCFESHQGHQLQADFVHLSTFSTWAMEANHLSQSTHHTTNQKVTHRFFPFPFCCREKSCFLIREDKGEGHFVTQIRIFYRNWTKICRYRSIMVTNRMDVVSRSLEWLRAVSRTTRIENP